MSQYLQDKVILITGAGGGFGQLIAEKVAAQGAKVVGVDINEAGLKTVFDGIAAAGFTGTYKIADVTDMDQVKIGRAHV